MRFRYIRSRLTTTANCIYLSYSMLGSGLTYFGLCSDDALSLVSTSHSAATLPGYVTQPACLITRRISGLQSRGAFIVQMYQSLVNVSPKDAIPYFIAGSGLVLVAKHYTEAYSVPSRTFGPRLCYAAKPRAVQQYIP
jgi:hypothetical protein